MISRYSLVIALSVTLFACQSVPELPAEPQTENDPVSQINLNIPDPKAEPETGCPCPEGVARDENYFDRGVRALAARDYERAGVYFERHRQEGGPQAQREADVGLAFVTLLDKALEGTDAAFQGAGVDERAEVMILALAAVQVLEGRLDALDAINKALTEDLGKREEALKRLRDLTLGQEEG